MVFNEYIGCLHIHLNIEKQKDFFDEIVLDAKKANLNFLILTPHTSKRKKHQNYFYSEGYKDRILVLTGEEADEKTGLNHLLLYGNRQWLGKTKVENILSSKKNKPLLTFAAHPDGKHKLFGIQTDHRWTKKNLLKDLTGLEVWSLFFDLAKNTNPSNLVYRYFSFPYKLSGPSDSVLCLWDKLLLEKKIVGVCGLDIHPLPGFIKLFDVKKRIRYGFVFKILRNHILTEEKIVYNFEKDREIVVNAFQNGRLFFANDFVADSTGFFFGSSDRKKTMGDYFSVGEELFVELPEKAFISVKCNSKTIYSGNTRKLFLKTDVCGACRVEAFYKDKPWIFSNPVFIKYQR